MKDDDLLEVTVRINLNHFRRYQRERLGFKTQGQAARYFGVSRQTYNEFECGRYQSPRLKRKLNEAYFSLPEFHDTEMKSAA